MKKIGDSTNTATDSGEWTEGNPAAGAAGTLLKADWLNTIQRELIAVVLGAGISLKADDDTQVLQAIQALAGTAADFNKLTNKPTTRDGYGITDVYTAAETEQRLNQRVSADTIIAAGFVSGDINRPYFLERKPDGSAGFIINLALSNHQHSFASLTAKPTTRDGYGLTDVYTSAETEQRLNQRVSADAILAAGFVSGDVSKPYFRERKPDGSAGFIINLALSNHQHSFASLTAKPTTRDGYGLTDVYTSAETEQRLSQRVSADSIVAAGFVSGDVNTPYFLQAGTNAIVHLARKTQVDAKPDADWIDAVGLVSNDPKLPYMHQKGGGNIILLARSELPRNTCQKGVSGWWKCADTGLLRQKVSIFLGDVSGAWSGSVTWPVTFPGQADTVKLSFLQTNGSPATISASYADLTTTGCKLRLDEWGTSVQYGLTIIVEAEGY